MTMISLITVLQNSHQDKRYHVPETTFHYPLVPDLCIASQNQKSWTMTRCSIKHMLSPDPE
jgi:hypothetical protein